ncbi:MAG: 4Fe-4S dicluster domain-containing protein [Nitrososphaeria archaeon]|jgi:ferredoxin
MTNFIMPEEGLEHLIKTLCGSYEVFGPVRKGVECSFEKITSAKDLWLDYPTTILPPKKFFTPPRETIFTFKEDKISKIEDMIPEERQILLGVHSCDMASFTFLDRVFLGFRSDPRYLRRRNNFLIFALTCKKVSETCFCQSMGTGPEAPSGYDVLMTDIGGRYLLEASSSGGNALLGSLGFQQATVEDFEAKRGCLESLKGQFKKAVNRSGLVELAYNNQEHPVWKKYGNICVACGQCAMVCPTCFCFDVKDRMDLSLQSGERYREWDVCLLLEFAEVALGGNFRKSRDARLRQFMCHNLSYGVMQYNLMKCVGCGRCIKACPVQIDITEIARELREVSS